MQVIRVSWCSSTSDNEVRVEVSDVIKILALRAQNYVSNYVRCVKKSCNTLFKKHVLPRFTRPVPTYRFGRSIELALRFYPQLTGSQSHLDRCGRRRCDRSSTRKYLAVPRHSQTYSHSIRSCTHSRVVSNYFPQVPMLMLCVCVCE